MSVFEYVVIEHPVKKDADRGELERVVVQPAVIVAKDKEHAKTQALLKLGDESAVTAFDSKRIEVLVRPFA